MLSALVASLVRLWSSTLRVKTLEGGELRQGDQWICGREIYAVSERDLLTVLPFTKGHRFLTLIAHGRDGDRATSIAERLGCAVIRGSSRRGGAGAARAFARALEEWDGPAVISVDGPLGPAGSVKPGIVFLAAGASRQLMAAAAASRRFIRIPGSWAGLEIPLPFTDVVVAIAAQAGFHPPLDRATRDRAAHGLKAELTSLREAAAAAVRGSHRRGSGVVAGAETSR